ncbi:RSPH10B [Symbiodinium natans]|uniref:RSPH10B protein n=1 Tax=Symbiodinium natans TaxID=878477 RepID=A0A812VAE7_9DINO|nr:RSPH10B [Symbiodinium natans]
MSSKRSKRRKEAKSKEVKKDLTPQFVNCDLADNKYSGIIREDHLGSQFLEGLASTYIWSTGTKYEGPFIASQIEGRGKFTWPDGSKYEDCVYQGSKCRPRSTATVVHVTAVVPSAVIAGRTYGWTKEWPELQTRCITLFCTVMDAGSGDGAYEALDGPLSCLFRAVWPWHVDLEGKTRYDGQWLDGKRHGQGKLTYSSDTTSYYDGGWQAGQKHGHGKQLWPSGNCYEGEWKLGKMSGQGTMIWRNGTSAEVYTGEWVDNCPHGEGTHTWLTMDPSTDAATTESWLNRPASPPSAQVTGSPGINSQQELRRHEAQIHATQQLNNRYTGQWVWGRREGTGTFYYANGAYYHGEWKSNVKEGHGRHTFDDGKVYDGKFEVDRMVDYSRPEPSSKGLDDNPICGCTDISDMEVILRPSDKAGFTQTPGSGYSDPTKILHGKGIYNVLLRNLGDLREGYSRSRSVQPQLGEDPHVMTLVQFWSLARDSGVLTPQSSIARFDRAIFSGPRHQSEMAPEDEQELEDLFPPSDKMATISLPRTGSSSSSKTVEACRQVVVAESKEQEFWDEATEALYDLFEAGGASGSQALGKKFLRSSASDGNLVHIHAPARPLLFRQFLESFVRMAPMRFPKEQGLEQQVMRLFKEQVAPCLKTVSGSKSEGGGLISMLANFRRPASSAFGLFTQPEVREVVHELEPVLWKIFVELSGDAGANEAVKSIRGGGIFSGSGGLGANPSNRKVCA